MSAPDERRKVSRGEGLLPLLLVGFDFAVGAIWGRAAFSASCLLTTLAWVWTVEVLRERGKR
jgi:hypothetical protein